MGFMQKLRQNMPAVIIFLIVMFVALIIFEWGAQRAGGGGRIRAGGTAIGEVNGTEISSVEFESRVKEAVEAQRQQNPDADVDEQPIRDAVWNQMVEDIIISQAAEKMGITVSDDEMRELLLYDPPSFLKQQFTDSTGYFDQALYLRFMTDIRGVLTEYQRPPAEIDDIETRFLKLQEELRHQRLREAVQSVIASTAVPAPAQAFSSFVSQKAKASGSFAFLDAATLADNQVTISDAEAKGYYDSHKAEFQQKAARELHYAYFPLNPSPEDSSASQRRLTKINEALAGAQTPADKDSLFASWIDQYGAGNYDGSKYTPMQEVGPELQARLQDASPGTVIGPVRLSDGIHYIHVVDVKDSGETYVKAQHILLKTGEGISEDSVKAQAEKILQQAKSGENFDQLAQQYSADQGSAQRGGDLGYFKKGMMVKPFEDASFNAAPGTIVGPVKSDFGYHIIKVNDRSSKSYKLRDLKFTPQISGPTRNLLRRRAQEFHTKLEEGVNIDSLGKRENVQVLESGPVEKSKPVVGSMRLSTFAWQGNQGDVSDVVELPDHSLAIAQITKARTPGVQEYADVKEEIINKLRTQKKLDMLKDRANKLRAAVTAGDSLSKLVAVEPAVMIQNFSDLTQSAPLPGVGPDYGITAKIFSMKSGEVSQPIRGERGYYIIKLDSVSTPTMQDFEGERKTFITQLMQQKKFQLFQEWLQKERERAEIVDLRGSAY